MEEILDKLWEIEATAKSVMEDAANSKKTLSEQMEQACRDFDKTLEKDTDTRIRKIRENLEADKDAQLSALRENTQESYASLDSYYEKNHERLSQEIFEKLIQM